MSTLWLPPPQVLLPGHDFAARPNTFPPFSAPTSDLSLSTFSSPDVLPPYSSSPSSSAAAAASSHSPFDAIPAYDRVSLKLPALMPGRSPGKRFFLCPHSGCGQTFTVNGNLKKHIAAKHELRKDFKCTHKGCGRSFAKKFNMIRHLNVHRSRGDKRSSVASNNLTRMQLVTLPMIARAGCNDSWSSDELVIATFMADHCADSSPTSSPSHSQLML